MDFDLSGKSSKNKKINSFFLKRDPEPEVLYAMDDLDEGEEEEPEAKNALFEWDSPEYVKKEKTQRWNLIASAILIAVVGYALYSNNPIMAITFVLIGVLGYIYLHKEPRILNFKILEEGVLAGKDLYEFDNIESFWIFYDPPRMKVLSLKTKGSLFPFVHIPIHREDPTEIRKHMLRFVAEEKQQLTMVDVIESYLGI